MHFKTNASDQFSSDSDHTIVKPLKTSLEPDGSCYRTCNTK